MKLNPQLPITFHKQNLLILCVMPTICKIWNCSDKKVRSDSSSWGQRMWLKLGVFMGFENTDPGPTQARYINAKSWIN